MVIEMQDDWSKHPLIGADRTKAGQRMVARMQEIFMVKSTTNHFDGVQRNNEGGWIGPNGVLPNDCSVSSEAGHL